MKYNNILVPNDFSEGSENALTAAIDFANVTKATIHIVHVITPVSYPTGFEMAASAAEFEKELAEISNTKLNEIELRLKKLNLNCKVEILFGNTYSKLIDYSEINNIDLICIATHGSGGIEHFIFGSTTEKILRKAHCPVYVVRFYNN
ncbi:MAG: universal stress protein [Candidatus Kapabacteria bacterium]|nr:universal stress protein [Candidatus Kapabacteria bacterium]